jgi:Zn-dependent protease with chaperone function
MSSGEDAGLGVTTLNPTDQVDLDFTAYVSTREQELGRHLVNGMPDYGFSLDHELRRRMAAIGPMRALAQAYTASAALLQKQLYQIKGVAIGPRQYPDIYALAEECAQRLGIGIPQLFVYPDVDGNAFTITTTDVAPIIVLSTTLVEALEPNELLFVIGHECGHIHNLHGVYQTAFEFISNPLAQGILKLVQAAGVSFRVLDLAAGAVQLGLRLFFDKWERCAEVTGDRAGLICCGDERVAVQALAKLTTRGGERLRDINIDEYVQQLNAIQPSSLRLQELVMDHPLVPRRIAALRHFAACEVLQTWRPERAGGTGISKVDTDRRCAEVLGILAGRPGPTGPAAIDQD